MGGRPGLYQELERLNLLQQGWEIVRGPGTDGDRTSLFDKLLDRAGSTFVATPRAVFILRHKLQAEGTPPVMDPAEQQRPQTSNARAGGAARKDEGAGEGPSGQPRLARLQRDTRRFRKQLERREKDHEQIAARIRKLKVELGQQEEKLARVEADSRATQERLRKAEEELQESGSASGGIGPGQE